MGNKGNPGGIAPSGGISQDPNYATITGFSGGQIPAPSGGWNSINPQAPGWSQARPLGGGTSPIGTQLPTSNAPPNAGPFMPLAQSNIPQGIPPQILQLLGQKGGAGMRPSSATGPIGTQGAPASPFSMQALTAQGRPYGFNPADPSRLEGAVRPAMSEVLGQNQGILDHMQRYRALQGGSGQPFDQGGLTPPATPPAATPPATPPPTQQQGWPTNLLGLLQAMGINTTG